MKDYYAVLGVSRDATQEDIKKAFRQLALKHHPDRNQGDKQSEEKFKEINEAYTCLSDPDRRAHYDRFGTAEGFSQGAGFGFGAGATFGDIFEDIFDDFFGGFSGSRRNRPAKGADLRYNLTLTLEEAASGTEKTISVPRWQGCEVCGGSGAEAGKPPVTCPQCRGAGQVRFQQGFFNVAKTCPKCQGAGRIITNPCHTCDGAGKVRVQRELTVKVPPGVDVGTRLKLTNEGDLGTFGGPPGDLYVIILMDEHPLFRREGTTIFCQVPLSFPKAVFGAEIDVPTLNGPAKLKIPAGTPSGKAFHLKGKGMPRLGSSHRGDQIVSVYIDVPKKLSPRERELLEEYARISGDTLEGASKGIKDKIKDLFSA